MKKDDKQPGENHTNPMISDFYFDAIQVGDIETLYRIEDTIEDPRVLLIHPTHTLLKSGTAMAAYHGQNHIIKHFIDKFDIDLNDMVMIAAIMGGQIETMLYLNQKVPEKQRIAFNVRYKEVILNGVKYNDLTLMHVAAFFGQIRIMIFLHKNSIVPPSQHIPYNVKTSMGVTPMHMAAAAEQINTMIFLRKDWRIPADERTRYNIKDSRGISPMQFAASSGKIDSLIFLNLDRRVSEHTPYDDKSYSGCTLMHAAAGCGQLGVMKFLADQGLRYDAKSDQGYTPMHTAASKGHLETMIYLNEDPAVPPEQRIPYDVKAEDGITPLDLAIAMEYFDIINFLKGKLIEASSLEESNEVNNQDIMTLPTSIGVSSVKNLRELQAVGGELREEQISRNKRSAPQNRAKSLSSNPQNKKQKTDLNNMTVLFAKQAHNRQGVKASKGGRFSALSDSFSNARNIKPGSEEPEEPQETSGSFKNDGFN